jgi:hypothetical protein
VNKKKQKNFIRLHPAPWPGRVPAWKSFLVLFFKKELLPCFLKNLRALHVQIP